MFGHLLCDIIVADDSVEGIFGFAITIAFVWLIVCVKLFGAAKRANAKAKKTIADQKAAAEKRAGSAKAAAAPSKSGMSAEEWYAGVQRRREAKEQSIKAKTSIEEEMEKRSKADHVHPMMAGKTVVEYVPTSGSLPDTSKEGCEEHRNVRFVETDDNYADDIDIDHELTPLQAMMVFGDVISKPKFKK